MSETPRALYLRIISKCKRCVESPDEKWKIPRIKALPNVSGTVFSLKKRLFRWYCFLNTNELAFNYAW